MSSGPFKLFLPVNGAFTPETGVFIGVFTVAVLTFLSKGNFLSEPWGVGACLGFSSFVYGFLTALPGIGFTYGALVFA